MVRRKVTKTEELTRMREMMTTMRMRTGRKMRMMESEALRRVALLHLIPTFDSSCPVLRAFSTETDLFISKK